MSQTVNVFPQGPTNLCLDDCIAEIQDAIFPNVYSGLSPMQKIMKWVWYIHQDSLTSDLTSIAQATAGIYAFNHEHPNEQLEYQVLQTAQDCYNAVQQGWYVASLLLLSALTGRASENYGHALVLENVDSNGVQIADSYGDYDGGGWHHTYPTDTVTRAIQSFYPPAGLAIRRKSIMATLPSNIVPQADGTLKDSNSGLILNHGFRNLEEQTGTDTGTLLTEEVNLASYPGNAKIGACVVQFAQKCVFLYAPNADPSAGLPQPPVVLAYAGEMAYALYQQVQAAQQALAAAQSQVATLQQELAAAQAQIAPPDPKAEALVAALKAVLA